jgi:hypothetical protein
MMWLLALEAWRLAGRLVPAYTRNQIPFRVFRQGDCKPVDDDVWKNK